MEYALLGGGKRIRPILCLRSCVAAGGAVGDALPAAMAIEMVHAFSLVHDDLPALDDDALRRGRPTLHKARGEAMAILAGDALQTIALHTANASPVAARAIAADILHAIRAMIEGQVLDTIGVESTSLGAIADVERIHALKTGALIESACRTGALAAGATPEHVGCLGEYGRAIGLMFQIVDDLLDATQPTERLGKTAGKDAALGRSTFLSVMGEEASRARIHALEEEAISAIKPLGAPGAPLADLATTLAMRTA
jgi:geranylgeranyl pyrophosphate synthase